MKEIGAGIEASVPLGVKSMHSIPMGVLATAAVTELYRRAHEFNYSALAIADWMTILGLAEGSASAESSNVKQLLAVQLPYQQDALHQSEPVTLLPRNEAGIAEMFRATDTANVAGSLSIQDVEASLQNENVTMLFPWRQHQLPQEFLLAPYAFLAFTQSSEIQRQAAHQLAKNKDFAAKGVIAHTVRMANVMESKAMHLLLRAFPQRAHGLSEKNLLNHVLSPPLGIAALYKQFPKGFLARSVEISQDIPILKPKFIGIPAHLPSPWQGKAEAFLWDRMRQRMGERWNSPELRQRIQEEMVLIVKHDYQDELCILLQGKDFMREREIINLTSGSGTHGEVGYAIGLNQRDAMHLWSGAFLHETRIDRPDFDTLVQTSRRREVIDFYKERYPEVAAGMVMERTMHEATVWKLSREHHVPLTKQEVSEIANLHIIFELAQHPSALLFQKQTLPQIMVSGNLHLQATAAMVEQWNIPGKIDLLSSVDLEQIAQTQQLLKKSGIIPDVDLNDPRLIQELFSKRYKVGVGYMSSFLNSLALRLKAVVPTPTYDHLVQLFAVARPAAAASRKEYFSSPHLDLNDVMIFKDQYKQAQLQLTSDQSLSPKDRQKKEQLMAGFEGKYGFLPGHAETMADLALWQTALELCYRPHFYAALFNILSKYGQSQKFNAQTYINQYRRRVGSFIFPTVEHLPSRAEVQNDSVVFSRQLLEWQVPPSINKRYLLQYYDRFISDPDKTLQEHIEFQFNHFGVCFSIDPIERFPLETRFDPFSKQIRTVIGLLTAYHTVTDKQGRQVVMATFDSGRLFNASFLKAKAPQLLQQVDNYGYYKFRLQPGFYPGSWDVV